MIFLENGMIIDEIDPYVHNCVLSIQTHISLHVYFDVIYAREK